MAIWRSSKMAGVRGYFVGAHDAFDAHQFLDLIAHGFAVLEHEGQVIAQANAAALLEGEDARA